VARCGLGLDLRLLAGTAVYLCGVSYAGVRRLLWLPNPLAALADPLADTVVETAAHA